MKIAWDIEGMACVFGRCGARTRYIEIDDADLEGLNNVQRDQIIEERVNDEFKREVYPMWTIAEE